jgi:hypothetical protein
MESHGTLLGSARSLLMSVIAQLQAAAAEKSAVFMHCRRCGVRRTEGTSRPWTNRGALYHIEGDYACNAQSKYFPGTARP